MKIEMEGSLLRLIPETETEKRQVNQIWITLIDCVKDGKRLVPVGEYLPGIKEVATFHIE